MSLSVTKVYKKLIKSAEYNIYNKFAVYCTVFDRNNIIIFCWNLITYYLAYSTWSFVNESVIISIIALFTKFLDFPAFWDKILSNHLLKEGRNNTGYLHEIATKEGLLLKHVYFLFALQLFQWLDGNTVSVLFLVPHIKQTFHNMEKKMWSLEELPDILFFLFIFSSCSVSISLFSKVFG